MTYLTMTLLLQAAALSAAGNDYATAYKQTTETGRPLVVLIGADWCPGCRTMKHSTIPQLEKKGGLNKVAFAYVNTDQDRELAGKLMSGGSIPQLVMFHKTADGWKRQQLTGAQSTTAVESFLGQATAAAPNATAKNAEPTAEKLSSRE